MEGEGEANPEDVDSDWGRCFIINELTIELTKGFDLDNADGDDDPTTGVDNFFGLAGGMANDKIKENVESGGLTLLIDVRADDPANNGPFPMAMYTGADQDEDPSDNFSGEETFDVELKSFKSDGHPLVSFPGTTIADRTLVATADRFPLSFPVGDAAAGEEQMFSATLFYARLEGTMVGEFGEIVAGNIGGAAREEEIRHALTLFDIPEDFRGVIEGILTNPDIDTDDDGDPDAFSLGLGFTAVSCEFGDLI